MGQGSKVSHAMAPLPYLHRNNALMRYVRERYRCRPIILANRVFSLVIYKQIGRHGIYGVQVVA